MSTTYEELWRKILLRLENSNDGRAVLASQQAVNDAQKIIARVHDFDEFIITDITSAATTDGKKTYHWVDDWNLTRPKDIISIRLIDGSLSRKLIWISTRNLDKLMPYPENNTETRPTHYTQRGNNFELIDIPDDEYDLYITYSQWPALMTATSDETPFADLDDVIIGLGSKIAQAILTDETRSWEGLALEMLSGAYKEEISKPDQVNIAQGFDPYGSLIANEWWKNPLARRDP